MNLGTGDPLSSAPSGGFITPGSAYTTSSCSYPTWGETGGLLRGAAGGGSQCGANLGVRLGVKSGVEMEVWGGGGGPGPDPIYCGKTQGSPKESPKESPKDPLKEYHKESPICLPPWGPMWPPTVQNLAPGWPAAVSSWWTGCLAQSWSRGGWDFRLVSECGRACLGRLDHAHDSKSNEFTTPQKMPQIKVQRKKN